MGTDVLGQVDLAGALNSEVKVEPEFLPKQPIDLAAAHDVELSNRWLASEIRELEVEPAPVVAMHKWRYGRRPVPALPLSYRVAYRAVVASMSAELAPARADQDHDDFTKAPIESGDEYVVVTDLSNYYSTIHIDALMGQLLAVTGQWTMLNWLKSFLTRLSGRPYGLPQGNDVSDLLGDTYAEILADNIRRRGIRTWRFADDFILGCPDRQTAIRALEVFDEETQRMGLYVNERKTNILSRDEYIKSTESKKRALTEAWREAREKLTLVDIYSDMIISKPTRAEVDVEAAAVELEEWWVNNLFETNPPNTRIDIKVLLAILGRAGNVTGIDKLADVISTFPEAGRSVAAYIKQMTFADWDEAMRGLSNCLKEPITKWHELWLVDVLVDGHKPVNWTKYPEDIRNWCMAKVHEGSVVTPSAVLALARHEALTAATLGPHFADADAYSYPYLIAAAARIKYPNTLGLSRSSLLDRLVCSWSEADL